ncbi:MAG: MOSC domain-containing protein [Gaiellales bacterium]
MSAARVAVLRSSPVKGLRQREVPALELVDAGLVGDRRFVLVGEDGRVRYGAQLDGLANVVADWGAVAGALTITAPDGAAVSGSIELGEEVEARSTSGARALVGRLVGEPFADMLSELAGERLVLLHVAPGVAAPGQVTIVGDGSLRRAAEAVGVTTMAADRFRMNIELAGLAPHHEDGWEGRLGRIGTATLRFGGQVPRCVLVTRDPVTRVRDHDVLRAILAYREPMATGEAPFGVYATVVEPGRIAVGDPVALA